ncbi:MAG TPA: hypothetical protein PK926_10715 [Spirochaetota bacterium]|nr:hypothetical protein [Spirochaetota bacterium]HPI90009.1 hypothetical protein [Spirochaetota bacterium]HPR47267.1 hypothetical protein [Spirochaetota bacterium]
MEEIKEQQFEEIADIPEKIADTKGIDHGTGTPDFQNDMQDGKFEEITSIQEKHHLSKDIDDDYTVQLTSDKDKDEIKPEKELQNMSDSENLEQASSEIKTLLKSKLPENFDFAEIGKIDLFEAEKIANEEILFLNEEDLIEGIEDFDLIPVNDDAREPDVGKGLDEKPAVFDRKHKPVKVKEDRDHDFIPVDNLNESVKPREKTVDARNLIPSREDTIEEITSEEVLDLNELFENKLQEEQLKVSSKKEKKESKQTQQINDEEFAKIINKKETVNEEKPEDVIDEKKVEVIPEKFTQLEKSYDNVRFIDDSYVVKDDVVAEKIFEDNELEAITSDIVEVIEGKTKVLQEAEIEDDKELVAHVLTGIAPVFEDLLLEFEDEYKYVDEEIEFIHSMLTEDDYSNYIKYIDEYYGIKSKKDSTAAIELIGLNTNELGLVEDKLFYEEYKDVNLYEIFDFFKTDYADGEERASISKDCTYILPEPESLLDEERQSIERDISSSTALIFEEDVEDIRDLFIKTAGSERAQKIKVIDEVYDITDRVVIIEDEYDIDQFVREFPDKRQVEVKRLLKYLDGLFEKLPRETLRKFVNSEYFDLYIKVLTELGV